MLDPPFKPGHVRLKIESPHYKHSRPVDLLYRNWNGANGTLDKLLVDIIRREFFLRPEAMYAKVGEYFTQRAAGVQGCIQMYDKKMDPVVSLFYTINNARDAVEITGRDIL